MGWVVLVVMPLRYVPRRVMARSTGGSRFQVVEGSFEFGERLLHPLRRTFLVVGRHDGEKKKTDLVVFAFLFLFFFENVDSTTLPPNKGGFTHHHRL